MTQSGSTVLAGSSYSAPYIALSTDGLTWQSQSGCQAALPTNAVAIKSKKSYYSARAVSISKFWASSGWGMSTYYWYENCYTSVTKVDGKDKYVGTTGTQSLYKSSTTYTAADGGSDDDASAIIVSPSDYNSTFTVTTSTEFVWSEFSKSKSASYSNSAVSSDGTVIVGAIGEGGLEISVDSGDTWTTSTAAGKHVDWSDVITSSDGSYIFAVTHGGSVYASNDYGVTLTEASVPVEDDFISVKCSSDGSIVLLGSDEDVYVSTDSGATFVSAGMTDTVAANTTSGYHVALSSDGSRLFAVSSTSHVFSSTDKGATWSSVSELNGNYTWTSLAATSDAGVLLASTTYGALYSSQDYGVTWTASDMTTTNPEPWNYVDISSNGKVWVASSKLSTIWVSTDSGSTWATTGTSDVWTSVSLTDNGKTIVTSSEGIDKLSKATYSPTNA